MKRIGVVIVLTGIALASFAQKGIEDGSKYGKGQDSINCLTNLSLYGEYYKQKDYKSALPYWTQVFTECPAASKNMYIHGAKMYNDKIKDEIHPIRLNEQLDTLMLIYDRRIEYFGERGDVLARKGVDLLRYKRDDIAYVVKGYEILKESISLEQNGASDPTIATFMTAAITLYTNDELDDNTLISDYTVCNDILDYKLSKKQKSITENIKKTIEQNMVATGVLSCDKIIEIYKPKFEATPDDVQLLEDIIKFMSTMDCTEDPMYYDVSVALYNQKPSVSSAVTLAQIALAKGKDDEAIKFFDEAVSLETEEANKADYYYGLAIAYNKKGDKRVSKEKALKAIEIKPDWGDPYILIGKLYASSGDECTESCIPAAVYWVAVDKFMKAKTVDPTVTEEANKLILTYKGYYPNKEKAFFCSVNEGDTFSVGCWINETTKARFE